MTDDTFQFYQQLVDDYHLIYADWTQSIARQGATLDRLIHAFGAEPPLDVLDCSCGIGTQAIGLAQRGYRVHATDLSPAAVARAAQEATAQGVSLTAGVADFRTLTAQVEGTFDLVLSCDNALPHLLTDADLLLAAQNMYAKLRDDGLLLISIRDYDYVSLEKPRATLPQVFDDPDGRRIVFQVWDWANDGNSYTFSMFILRQSGQNWITRQHAAAYRVLLRADLNAVLEQAGFTDLRWHMPQDTGYHQPIVTARR